MILRVPVVNESKFPQDVLLEIFNAYRQLHELQPRYEHVWNSRDGWFKLTHVCQSWRRLVHLSPSYLHVHLLFTSSRSSSAAMLRRLPPLPISIDYSNTYLTSKDVDNALVLIKHRSRVRGITLHIQYRDGAKFIRALSLPFPKLESLNICLDFAKPILPATFLSNPVPFLQRLTLHGVVPSSILSPILSSATGLVELSLRPGYTSHLEPSLLRNLQHLSHLHHLELDLSSQSRVYNFIPPLPSVTGDVVPWSKLTHLIFKGHILSLESLVVGLAAPSLQHLTAQLYGAPPPHIFPIPHLCKFICDAECHFTAVCLSLSSASAHNFCAGTVSQSIDEEPFINISLPSRISFKKIGQELSGPLSTVEELNIKRDVCPWELVPNIQPDELRGFFYYLPQLKVVQIPVRMAYHVTHSFQQDNLEDLLPALQQVKFERCARRDGDVKFVCNNFGPLMAARERAGHPIGLDFS